MKLTKDEFKLAKQEFDQEGYIVFEELISLMRLPITFLRLNLIFPRMLKVEITLKDTTQIEFMGC